MFFRLSGVAGVLLGLIACGRGGDRGGDDTDATEDSGPSGEAVVESSLEEDLSFLLSTSALANDIDALNEGSFRDEDNACYTTAYGGCNICYALVGGPATGDFTVAVDDACGVEVAVDQASASYSLVALSVTGAWEGTPFTGDYEITAVGSSTSEISVDGPSDNEPWEFDASWNLVSMEMSTVDYYFDSATAELTYTGFANQEWTAAVILTTTSVTGTLSRADGDCTIGGTVDGETVDVALDCD